MMFRGNVGFQERVDVIGNNAFLSFVDELEKIEGFKLDTFELGKEKLRIITISPDEKKLDNDIEVPDLSPALVRKKSLNEEISEIDVMKFNTNVLPLGQEKPLKSFIYEGRDILTDEKLFEREYKIPEAQTSQEVIGYYARKIANDIKLPSQFAVLVPKIKEFFSKKAFGKEVDLDDPSVIKAMSSNVAAYIITKEFEKVLRDKIIEEKEPEVLSKGHKLSSTPPFPFSKQIYESKKNIFNYVACDNDFEIKFAKFLNGAEDVVAFAKLPEQFGFCIEYTDTLANLRNYYPDFAAKLNDETHWLIETKGREDLEVARKDEAAKLWCENATNLTGIKWNYLKVPQKEFELMNAQRFCDLQNVLFAV
jgi:type III restriction enzyme